ncbi:[FeFe] hydrogenase H-cluster radical SAM maturase HydE [Anaerostipes amylophilus]|uniref:[FeFe] hydrogenase H-cluster radical SAM maturase HydE n=1 Tax=Anaerostipes amylophilus TaxID=2981779 RepID=A0ABV1IRK6_9FIRM
MNLHELIDRLHKEHTLTRGEFITLIKERDEENASYLASLAREEAVKIYGNGVFPRGLVEFTNYCKNNCYYCGIQGSNQYANRYRLSKDEILSACENGYQLGYRSFVLQGGEDPHYSDDVMVPIVSQIRKRYQDCAITLSLGERSKESYQKLYDAGADRYLLRHEAATPELYQKLHPESLSLENRIQCLWNLKEIGYAVGTGFMVGAPYQTVENLVDDLLFIQKLDPQMVGIGPFVPHHDTKFKDYPSGTVELTTYLTSILRLMNPHLLLPATTALGTIDPRGREKGILAGANVVMPNLSPVAVRKDYSLYDNKICTGEEAAECAGCLGRRLASIDYELVFTRGDYIE